MKMVDICFQRCRLKNYSVSGRLVPRLLRVVLFVVLFYIIFTFSDFGNLKQARNDSVKTHLEVKIDGTAKAFKRNQRNPNGTKPSSPIKNVKNLDKKCKYIQPASEKLFRVDRSRGQRNYSQLEYGDALKEIALDNVVILSLIDMGCIHMALNFWETSLVPLRIENYLFITSDYESCNILYAKNIPCYIYAHDKDSKDSSLYTSMDFIRKMFIRTSMILKALRLSFNVLHTDVDIVFFSNPLDDIACKSNECDIALLWDYRAYNAGFLFARPTNNTIRLYELVEKTGDKVMDQHALNGRIKELKSKKAIKAVTLNQNKYQCGKNFWEIGQRTFAGDNPCKDCIVVHNNWIISMQAKVYRFREMHFWKYDGPEHYYTDNCRKYLVYDNVDPNTKLPLGPIEKEALRSALAIGLLLNRTVILPVFHFSDDKRSTTLLNQIKIRDFEKEFPNYREHTFLSNPKVPKEVVTSSSESYLIESDFATTHAYATAAKVKRFYPKDPIRGARSGEILEWFANNRESILRFHSLYRAFCCFEGEAQNENFNKKISSAFKNANYLQS